MLLQNKYSRWYFSIIENAKRKDIYEGYIERHHIIPASLGGSSLPDNIVKLTAREHFICHRLLVKFTVGKYKRKMALAVLRLCNPSKFHIEAVRITGRKYEHIKKLVSESKKGVPAHPNVVAAFAKNRNKNGGPNKGKTIHANSKAALLKSRLGIPLTDEHKQKLSAIHAGRTIGDEWKKNMSNAAKNSEAHKANLNKMHQDKIGIPLSSEHKDKLSLALTGRKRTPEEILAISVPKKKIECPHCKMIGGSSQMKRYHFDNCKFI